MKAYCRTRIAAQLVKHADQAFKLARQFRRYGPRHLAAGEIHLALRIAEEAGRQAGLALAVTEPSPQPGVQTSKPLWDGVTKSNTQGDPAALESQPSVEDGHPSRG